MEVSCREKRENIIVTEEVRVDSMCICDMRAKNSEQDRIEIRDRACTLYTSTDIMYVGYIYRHHAGTVFKGFSKGHVGAVLYVLRF